MTIGKIDRSRASQQALAKEAITLATQGQWQAAAEVNQEIVQRFPEDASAYNRLGKSLMELGRYSEAKEAFQRGLNAFPGNVIAKKNLQRLESLAEENNIRRLAQSRVAPHHFIEEMGKSGVTRLINLGDRDAQVRLGAGQVVSLRTEGSRLLIDTTSGEYVGQVELKLASRLLDLMKGGNRYEGSITSAGDNGVSVILRETYQHPSQVDKVSFPSKTADKFRAYVKESVKRYERGEGETWSEEEEEADPLPEGITIVEGEAGALATEDEEAEEEEA